MSAASGKQNDKRFAWWLCILFLVFASIVFVFKRTDLFPWIGECHPGGYSDEHFLAYCHSTRYGDYEHYALYHATEADAVDALKQADVLFLGNSNTQYAFSTHAISDYFVSSELSHYVMGFGSGAQSPVAEAVIKKHALQPTMMVANVDPFFSTETNGTFQYVLDNGDSIHTEFNRKQRLQKLHRRVCEKTDSFLYDMLCQGSAETLYRSRKNGHWLTDHYRDNAAHPVSESDYLLDTVDKAVDAANRFIASNNMARECVVLTLSPRTDTPAEFAKALAEKLDLPLIMPELEGLVTIDHSHLDENSAERWSTAFLAEFDRYVELCRNATTL